jgi:hypothetical protein
VYHPAALGDGELPEGTDDVLLSVHLHVPRTLTERWRWEPYAEVLCWVVVERKAAVTGTRKSILNQLHICLPQITSVQCSVVILMLHETKGIRRVWATESLEEMMGLQRALSTE